MLIRNSRQGITALTLDGPCPNRSLKVKHSSFLISSYSKKEAELLTLDGPIRQLVVKKRTLNKRHSEKHENTSYGNLG